MLRYIALITALTVAPGPVRTAHPDSNAVAAGGQIEIDRLVHDVCGRDVVLLGEDSYHGSGRTVEVKSLLVQRLVNECGFSQVLFESQFYEFPALEKPLATGQVAQRQLGDAIGGIWSRTAQMQPLLTWLADSAAKGKVRIGGIDPQFASATGHFAQCELGGLLAARLPREFRGECRQTFDRHHAWSYDDDHPYDDAEKDRLGVCIGRVEAAVKRNESRDPNARMVLAYARYAPTTLSEDVVASKNARDLGMAELFDWYRERDRRKTIVWTATVHAAKQLEGDRVPMGHYLHQKLGDRMATIGFTAVAGSIGGAVQKQAKPLAEPQSGALEARYQSLPSQGLVYLSYTELADMGTVPARALNYAQPQVADWSELLDGMIVLGEEHPAIQLPK